jgi:aspartate/methionine/tyrosine aminotransferase
VVDPERIVITASSSESYGFLFKLLCDPGDSVLVPAPSYPLFEHLAALEGVRVEQFPLDPENAWQPRLPDPHMSRDARAVILVHPNNPTGSWVDPAIAVSLPLIVDEVFLDYPLAPHEHAKSFAARTAGLTFTLGGLSKSPRLAAAEAVVDRGERTRLRRREGARSPRVHRGTATSRSARRCRMRFRRS